MLLITSKTTQLKTEIKIILEGGSSNKAQGSCFEDLIRNLLSTHQYKIRQNIRFTGMELDLLAEHKQRTNEILYVECKAKEKVSSIELRTFFANVFHHKANFGYFFRTNELEFDAGGLLHEYRNDKRYSNLTFFEPEDIIKMLSESKMIFEPLSNLEPFSISKKILIVSYFGDYLIYLVNESNLLPTKFILIDAKNNSKEISKENISLIKEKIDEIKNLEPINNLIDLSQTENEVKKELYIETISEVQESENWFDPLPASSKDFVGRDVIRTQILEYFKEIHSRKTQKRIFYLNGKSGWGKSSLVLEIKGRCRNRHYKNKFFTIAIDTRSALSDNFVALSFDKLITSAYHNKFIKNPSPDQPITFTSNVDLLSSDSIQQLLQKLKAENKFLILIFDQFEDVFKKKDLFKSFYKFLSDITDKKPNLIIGFSWKTEIIIPIEHEAYSYWQQAKEQAREFTISEFGEKEIDGLITQLEDSIGKLEKEIKNRIKESSQGLPWLTKKLCIHIYEQIKSGLKKEKLIESNLNIKDLFEKDKERIEGGELKALKHIAQKAYDGDFFEISEVGESIENKTIDSLLQKRLIIRSGANYNIYWDIFRDYLVTNIIPPIGESYLLRQSVNLCLEVFLLFQNSQGQETLDSLLEKHPKKIGILTLENILIELRNFGIVQKNEEYYAISKDNIEISNEGFINYATEKFQNYTPYLALKKLDLIAITKDDVIKVLKSTFKQEYKDKTWDVYSNYLIGWFLFSNIDIKSKMAELKKGRKGIGKSAKLNTTSTRALPTMPRNSLKHVLAVLESLKLPSNSIKTKLGRDLFLFKIINKKKELTELGKTLLAMEKENQKTFLVNKAVEFPKMQELQNQIKTNPKISAEKLIKNLPDGFFGGKTLKSQIVYASQAMTWIRKGRERGKVF